MKPCLLVLITTLTSSAFAQQGQWEDTFFFGNDPVGNDAIVAVHLVHVFNGTEGKVMAITFGPPHACLFPGGGKVYLWTPPPASSPSSPGQFQSIPNCDNYVFCAGHSALGDGRILVAGSEWAYFGDYPFAELFDPNFWSTGAPVWNQPRPPSMAHGRWYPTCTTLSDGKVLVTAGIVDNSAPPPAPQHVTVTIPELYDPTANTFTLTPNAAVPEGEATYPWMFLLPDGNVIKSGHGAARILIRTDPSVPSTWTWGPYIQIPSWPDPPPTPPGENGSAVTYAPGKIMICGGQNPAVGTTFMLDCNNIDPYNPPPWLIAGNMHRPRRNHNLVVLPDGKIAAIGGNVSSNQQGQPVQPVFAAELFDPEAGTWSPQPESDNTQLRMYHSTAMLLRDGRVVSAGANNYPTAQIFKPPYITSGAPRPRIATAPSYMQYGQQYTITYDQNGGPPVSKACLIRLAAVTHGFDQDQRRVPLAIPFESQSGELVVTAPANGNIAPPGYYMLFILNEYARNQYAPCEMAKYVKVGP